MAWTNIPNANLAIGSPVRSVDLLAIRDNIPAIANGDSGAPKIKNDAYTAGSISADKLNGNQSGSAPAFASRAWVNFNGTGTVAIRSSGNISSITDNGTGKYTVNLITAMIDTNYAVVVGGRRDSSESQFDQNTGGYALSSSQFSIHTADEQPNPIDFLYISAVIFR